MSITFHLFSLLDTASNLKLWAKTRWDSRWLSIDTIKNNYAAVVTALTDLIDEGGHRAIDARGLLAAVQEALFIVSMFTLHMLLGPIKILSDQLKCKINFPTLYFGHDCQ